MRKFLKTPHYFEHYSTTDAIIPGLGEVAIVGKHRKVGNRSDRVAGRDAELSDVLGRPRASVEIEVLLRRVSGSVVWSNVSVPNVGDGKDGSFGAGDDPALIGEGGRQPIAEHLHGDESIGADASDHAAKFVHVSVE